MDRRQAKSVLACYRPGLDDPRSEPFAEALEQARGDPDLAHWLEAETALDAAIAAKVREARVPPDLEARILAHRPAAAPVAWWRRPLVAFAPVAAVLIAVIVFAAREWWAPPGDFASYRAQMSALVAGEYKLDVEARDLPTLRGFFARRGWPADYSAPPSLERYPLEGGMAVNWRGRKVSVVCFGVEDDESKDMWLFVVERGALPGAPSSSAPDFARVSKLMTASWSSADKLYLLAGRGDERALREFL